MAYGKRSVSTAALKKYTARSKRRRTANTTRIRYQAPTARNQRKQIMTNAKSIKRLYELTLPKQVYTDWQYVGQAFADVDAGGAFTRTWAAFPLMGFGAWGNCLRQDVNVAQSSSTLVQRLQINMRYILGNSNYAYFNVFVVTLRKDAANRDPPAEFAAGSFPNDPADFIEGPLGCNIRLNSALYKVHFASYHTLTDNNLTSPVIADQTSGNPFSTWRKGQVNIQCKANIRNPVRSSRWTQLPYMAVPHYKRYFILCNIVQQADAGVQADTAAQFAFDQLATCVNST